MDLNPCGRLRLAVASNPRRHRSAVVWHGEQAHCTLGREPHWRARRPRQSSLFKRFLRNAEAPPLWADCPSFERLV